MFTRRSRAALPSPAPASAEVSFYKPLAHFTPTDLDSVSRRDLVQAALTSAEALTHLGDDAAVLVHPTDGELAVRALAVDAYGQAGKIYTRLLAASGIDGLLADHDIQEAM